MKCAGGFGTPFSKGGRLRCKRGDYPRTTRSRWLRPSSASGTRCSTIHPLPLLSQHRFCIECRQSSIGIVLRLECLVRAPVIYAIERFLVQERGRIEHFDPPRRKALPIQNPRVLVFSLCLRLPNETIAAQVVVPVLSVYRIERGRTLRSNGYHHARSSIQRQRIHHQPCKPFRLRPMQLPVLNHLLFAVRIWQPNSPARRVRPTDVAIVEFRGPKPARRNSPKQVIKPAVGYIPEPVGIKSKNIILGCQAQPL